MEFKTPFFIVSKREIWERIKDIKGLVNKVYYSYKTNPYVGDIIISEGYDIGLSLNHINSIKNIPQEVLERSIYYLQSEDTDVIKYLVKKGIKRFVVDNENDLKKLMLFKDIEEISIRIKYREHTFYTGKYFVYGISWKKIEDIIRKYSLYKKYKIGLHFHKKTQNVGEWYLFEDFFDMFSEDFLKRYQIYSINIGGGIPWRYVNSKPEVERIFKSIRSFKNKVNKIGVELLAEPGRYIAAPSVRLKVSVINKYDDVLVVNASIYNAYMDTYLLHHRLPLLEESEKGEYSYTIKGNTLDSLDIFRYSASFEKPINIYDDLTFLNAGAYNFHCNFSFLDPIPYKVIEDFDL